MIGSDWQIELRGLTMGAETAYVLTGPITGLGLPVPRTSDGERGNEPGDVGGTDVPARRILTVAITVNGADAAAGWALYETLKGAWASSVVDVAFDHRLPGFASVARRYYGRPRGLDDDQTLLRLGVIPVLATFEALDPWAYGLPDEVVLVDGTTALTNPGSQPTDRYVVELDVTTGPVVFSTGDVEPALTLIDVTGTVIIDGRARTIVDGTGADLYGRLAAGSGWPILTPGAGTIVLSGATGTLTWRPAYQ